MNISRNITYEIYSFSIWSVTMQHLKVFFVVASFLLASQINVAEAQRRKGALGLGKLFQMAKQFPESCQAECSETELPIQVLVESDADRPDM